MNILVSNDDGIECPGLLSLVDQLSEIGDVYVVAPAVQQSAKSHAFTFKGAIQVEERTVPNAKKAFALWGTPCDCTHIGLSFLIKEKIDLVVSGINIGKNAGSDAIYSGTCAAAREGMLMNVPAIAMSLDSFKAKEYQDFEAAAYIAKVVARKYAETGFSTDYFLNVNVPYLPLNEIKGIKICDKYGYILYDEKYTYEKDGDKTFVRMENVGQKLLFDENDNSIEAAACRNGYISIAPLKADQIDHEHLNKIGDSFGNLTL